MRSSNNDAIRRKLERVQAIYYFSQEEAEAKYKRELQEDLGCRPPRGSRVLPDVTHGGIRKRPSYLPKKKRLRPMTRDEKVEQVLLFSIQEAFPSSSDPRRFHSWCSRLEAPSPVRAAVANPNQQSRVAGRQTKKSFKRFCPFTVEKKGASTGEPSKVEAADTRADVIREKESGRNTFLGQVNRAPAPKEKPAQTKRVRSMTAVEKAQKSQLCATHPLQRALDFGRHKFLSSVQRLKRELAAEQASKAAAIAEGRGQTRPPLNATPESVIDIAAHLQTQRRTSAAGSAHSRRAFGFVYATPKMRREAQQHVQASTR